jgi:hypothetical protein
METLLQRDFTAHYRLDVSSIANISIQAAAQYFEIEDDQHRETQIHFTAGLGMAAYSNRSSFDVTIINYDKFITSLPNAFQNGRQRCDLIVYTNTNNRYFLLNELKDRKPNKNVRKKAKSQLLESLQCIMAVTAIRIFVNQYTIKRCCYFNKKAISPPSITAPSAFNRLNQLTLNGIQMSSPGIESLGFEFYQYSKGQVLTMA